MAGAQFPSRNTIALLNDGAAVVFESATSSAADIVAKVVLGVVGVGETSYCGTATAMPAAKIATIPMSCIFSRVEPCGCLCSEFADLDPARV